MSTASEVLGSDTPVKLPSQDAFGYAPFAASIAKTAVGTPSPNGLVLAVHGPWGSGKSSLLNFIRHDLLDLPPSRRPLIISFNPWMFDDDKALIGQFLAQFAVQLPPDSKALAAVRNLLADYSSALGTGIATLAHLPFLKFPLEWLFKLFRTKKKDIPEIKAEIAEKLREENKRIVFFIDDIDRLDASEMASVFKAVKALADFPNVVYILAFDPALVARSIGASLNLDGAAYLEKIVPAPFALPAISKPKLRKRLHEEINRIIKTPSLSPEDEKRWARIYLRGLDRFVSKPRDIVRISNALTVTYAAVVGEVNEIDFIALEFIRVFEPSLYALIRDNPEHFVAVRIGILESPSKAMRAFHDGWLKEIPDRERDGVQSLVRELFPQLDSLLANTFHSAEAYQRWRNERRICASENFDLYFQLSLQEGELSNLEVQRFLAADRHEIERTLLSTGDPRKTEAYFESVINRVDSLDKNQASRLLPVLFDVADTALPRVNMSGAMFPMRWRLIALADKLLTRLEPDEQKETLTKLVTSAKALTFSVSLIDSIEQWKDKASSTSWLGQLSVEEIEALRSLIVARMESVPDEEISHLPELDLLTNRWMRWGDPKNVAQRLGTMLADDRLMLAVLEGFLRYGTRSTAGDVTATFVPRLNPNDLSAFTDIHALEGRVKNAYARRELSQHERVALKTYQRSMELIRQGKDPAGFFASIED